MSFRTALAVDQFFTNDTEEVDRLLDGASSVLDLVSDVRALIDRIVVAQREPRILGTVMPGAYVADVPVYIHETAIIEPGACILGPAYIGPGVVVRHGAYIRSDVIMLTGSVLGHASEAKSAIFLPGAKAPHFAYVGDSILGHRVNLGAGTKLSNLTITSSKDAFTGRRGSISVPIGGEMVDTGLSKLGAILGDDVQVGCNAVLSPGTFIRPRSLVYANASIPKGIYGPDVLIKASTNLSVVERLAR